MIIKDLFKRFDDIFIDCGFHHGEGLKEFYNLEIINNKTRVYSFEANPECKLKERIKNIRKDIDLNVIGIEKAVWINNGFVEFFQENHISSMTGSPSDGTSNIDGWGSSIKDVKFQHKGYHEPIKIPCIDFSEFIEKLPNKRIICKMDIEGSEFFVLRHLINQGTIKKINDLYIEFHQRFMIEETDFTVLELIKSIESDGVNVFKWK